MNICVLVRDGLAVWRVSYMLTREDGPNRIFTRLRDATGVETHNGMTVSAPDWNPLGCIMCTSLYVAAALTFVPTCVRDALAASGLACLVESVRFRL